MQRQLNEFTTGEPQPEPERRPDIMYRKLPLPELKRKLLIYIESVGRRQCSVTELYGYCEKLGVSESQIDRAYSQLSMNGLIYEPRPGVVRLI